MKCCVISPDGKVEVKDISGLKGFQAEVGGFIEAIKLSLKVSAYINEEGKMKGLPVNVKATIICHEANAIAKNDFIVGPFVIFGETLTGDETDCPEAVIKFVKSMKVIDTSSPLFPFNPSNN